ncbi:MAG: DUF1194 domain-containing protein [Cyanobacteria bacterium P01_E01_bin.42]
MSKQFLGLGAAGAAIAAGSFFSTSALAGTLVSTELVLSVDISASVNSQEFDLQRQGYVDAFRDLELIELIEGLEHGIAVTMQYWSTTPATPLPWYRITDAASANAFADAIAAAPRPESNLTNIAAAIESATALLLNNEFDGQRMVIDVSGDGRQNTNIAGTDLCARERVGDRTINNDLSPSCYGLVTSARDAAVAAGITINGLPILTDVTDLDSYFLDYAIGGNEAFVQAAVNFSDFEAAVKTKIKREIIPEVQPESVPEPSVTLGLLLGLLGGRSFLKRRDRA